MQTSKYRCALLVFLFLSVSFITAPAMAQATIEVKGSALYLNGTLVKLPASAAEVEKIVGKADRSMAGVRRVLTWDKLGLIAYQKLESDDVIEINAILNITDNSFPFTPERSFAGSLTIDGAKLTSTSTRDSINRSKIGGKFKPIPAAGFLSDYKTGDLYLVMWQQEKRGASGSGKILQISISIDAK